MPDLSDRLKAMGVNLGARQLKPPANRPANPLAELGLRPESNRSGLSYQLDRLYPCGYLHGSTPIEFPAALHGLAAWAHEPGLPGCPPGSFVFLDTETSGLGAGTGTYVFLLGVARFTPQGLLLTQFFLADPADEPAMLAAMEAYFASCEVLVSFNGKSFDLPLLTTRFQVNTWPSPFAGLAHLDLLQLARKLWRSRLPSRTLGNLEVQIIGAARSGQDVPGWMVPQLYFDFLRSGDPQPLASVLYHNEMDVVSLAALFCHMTALLADPLHHQIDEGLDWISLGRLFEDLGQWDTASSLYLRGLEFDLPRSALLEAIQRLAYMNKKLENYAAALQLWETAAGHDHLNAHLELSKFYEHHQRDDERALTWANSALEIILKPTFHPLERHQHLPEIRRRIDRLEKRIGKRRDQPGTAKP
jgi:hypothetical protein